MSLLHVTDETLEKHGAVSEETVIRNGKGAMKTLKTDCAVATSGIAGPGGGTPEKPVGTVWIAAAYKNEIITMKQEGDEEERKMWKKQFKMHFYCFVKAEMKKKCYHTVNYFKKNLFYTIKVLTLRSV